MGVGISMENSLETFTNKTYLLKSIEPMLGLELHRFGDGRHPGHRHPLTAKYKPKDVTLNPKKRVGISDLVAEETLRGMYLLCKTLSPPFQMKAIALIVEDPEGGDKAVRLCLYDYHDDDKQRPVLEDIFPVGTILAIYNPWFKMNFDGGYSVRVERHSDVKILSEKCFGKNFPDLQWKGESSAESEKNPSAEQKKKKKSGKAGLTATDWKEKGNKHFVLHEYEEAFECYTEGLKKESNNVDILSNRAASAIQLGYFHKALEDSEKTLTLKSDHLKGVYRKTKALAGLERYGEAIKFLESKMSQFPELKKTDELKMLNCTLRKMEGERSSGNYDFLSLYSGDNLDDEEIADFQGDVEIANIPNKGRGLVATKDIPAGTLLIVCKAFAIVYEEDLEAELLLLNTDEDAICRKALVANIIEKLKVEPELRKPLLGLYAGKDFSDETEDNSVDMEKIVEAVCHYNAIPGKRVAAKEILRCLWSTYLKNDDEDEDDQKSFGLWVTPSYINHSCWDSNCFQMTFGNIMIVRSHKNISNGEEILLSYIQPTETLFQRQKFCQNLGFVCHCTICEMESSLPKPFVRERKNIFNGIKYCTDNPFMLSKLITRLENMSWPSKNESNQSLNTTMLFALERLGFVYMKKFNFDAAAEAHIKAYNLAKDTPMILLTIHYAIQVVATLLCAKKKKLAKRWRNVLERHVAIAFGHKPKEVVKLLAEDTPLNGDSDYWENFEELREIMTS